MKPGRKPEANALPEDVLQRATQREAQVLGTGPRLLPLHVAELTPELLDMMARFESVNSVLQSSAEGDRGGTEKLRAAVLANPGAAATSPEILAEMNRLPEIMRTMLRHAGLFACLTELGLQLLARGTLSLRHRELAVLRIAWLCQAPYEWGEHVLVGKRFGLTADDIARVIDGPAAAGLSPLDSAVLRAVDELYSDAMISDATWDALARDLDEQQLIELPIIVGQYQTVAYYQNSLRLRLHKGNLGLRAR